MIRDNLEARRNGCSRVGRVDHDRRRASLNLRRAGPILPYTTRFPRPTTMLRSRTLPTSLFTLLTSVWLMAGCKEATVAPVPGRLVVVQGQAQMAAVGSVLPVQLVFRVLSTDGAPMPQVPVSFSVSQGGGTIDPPSLASDANGEVKAKWTLGPASANQQVTASVRGLDPVPVNATGILPTDLVIVQGNNQSAKAGAALATQVIVRVVGNGNVPIPNQTVAFAIATGGGSISPASAVTSALGEVTVRWTLGPTPGAQTATATAGTVGPAVLTATAN